ncbi:hypothetical protein pipiens_011128 [Culex pipiens pipiens]|uniref:Uncharacterized protein n=1 Tax=Culex pipiens pipiens TaxID=38569 RepID=A0ABD1D8B7_CULPP
MISTAGSKQPSQYQSSSATTSTDHHAQAMATNSNSTVLTTSGIIARMTSSSVEKQRTVSDSESEINYDMFSTSVTSADGAGSSLMNSSQISNTSTDSTHVKSANLTRSQNVGGSCRFPKLEECAHFHYERVQLGRLSVRLVADEKNDSQLGSLLATSTDLSSSQTGGTVITGGHKE